MPALLMLFIVFSVHAQVSADRMNGPFLQPEMQDNRIEITKDQLPEGVLKTLTTDAYKDWAVTKAYKVTASSDKDRNKVHYEVLLKLNDKETTLKLDEDGNILE